jgi:hypothetical protein
MKRLHIYLKKNIAWYRWWHKQPDLTIIHFALLTVFVTFFASIIFFTAQDDFIREIETDNSATPLTVRDFISSYNKELIKLSNAYDKVDDSKKPGVLNQLQQLAAKRKSLMLSSARKNPNDFRVGVLTASERRTLPEAVQNVLERETDVKGTLKIIHYTGSQTNRSRTFNEFRIKDTATGKEYSIRFEDTSTIEKIPPGSLVSVHGAVLDSELVVIPIAFTQPISTETPGPSGLLSIVGKKSQLVVLVNFRNLLARPWTTSQVRSTFFDSPTQSVNSYYKEISFNQLSFTGNVTGWYTLPSISTGCDLNYKTWAAAANALAKSGGFDPTTYDHVVYITPPIPGCAFTSISDMGGKESWVFGYSDNRPVAQAIGHNLGIQDSTSLICGRKQIDIDSKCILFEHGELGDGMGNNWSVFPVSNHWNAPHKIAAGWIPESRVQTVTASGQFSIAPLERTTNSVQVLKIPKPNTKDYYYVSYRQPVGYDATMPTTRTLGAEIHMWDSSYFSKTKLLDTTPGNGLSLSGYHTGVNNAALSDRATFTDSINDISIKQLSHSSNWVTVYVSVPGSGSGGGTSYGGGGGNSSGDTPPPSDNPFAWLSGNTLFIRCANALSASISRSGATVTAIEGSESLSFPSSQFSTITILGTDGADVVNLSNVSQPITFNGSAGADSLNVLAGIFGGFTIDPGMATPNMNVAISSGAGALFTAPVHLNSLSIQGNVELNNMGASRFAISVKNLSITGKLDLHDNGLIYDYTDLSPIGSWNGTSYSGVTGLIATGRNGGDWRGNGIMTTAITTANNVYNTLGVGEARNVLAITGTQTASWYGNAVDATSVLVKFTYGGDINIDGKIDILDYSVIDSNVPIGLNGYDKGDMTYDGKIDILDYSVIDSNVPIQGPRIN